MKRILLGLAVLAAVSSSSAWALESGNSNLTLLDGSINMSCVSGTGLSKGILVDADGDTGTNSFSCVNALPSGITVPAGNLSGQLDAARVIGTDTCGATEFVRCTSGNCTCEPQTGGGSFSKSLLVFSSETKIRGATSSTVWMGPSGKLYSTAIAGSLDQVWIPFESAATLSNFRCKLDSPLTGTSPTLTLNLHSGLCNNVSGVEATQTTSLMMFSGGGTAGLSTYALNIPAASANSNVATCVGFKLVSTNSTNNVSISCSIEKTA